MPAQISVRSLERTRESMRQIADNLHGKPMVDAMERAAIVVAREAKKNAPVDTGRLRASITSAVKTTGLVTNQVQGVVGTNVEYAPFMELGTGVFAGNRPHRMPPVQALQGWARRHGTKAYLVARAIAERGGLEPRHFLRDAVEDNRDKVIEIIGKGVKSAIERS